MVAILMMSARLNTLGLGEIMVMTSWFLSIKKFYQVTQIILYMMWLCGQSLVTLAFLWEKLSKPQFWKGLTRKTNFFQGCPWFKFNNLRVELGVALKFYTSMTKRETHTFGHSVFAVRKIFNKVFSILFLISSILLP